MRRTKILATIGPATEDMASLERLVESGMNIARLNCSHGTEEQFAKIVANIRAIEKKSGRIISILGDLQGPKIRLGQVEGGKLLVTSGEQIIFSTKAGEAGTIHIPYPDLHKIVKAGEPLLIEDGLIRTKILSVRGNRIHAKVSAGGYLKNYKGVNLPESKLPNSETLTAKDKADLKMLLKLGADAIALSFVESADDVLRLQKEIKKHQVKMPMIISKIERKKALKNIKEIIDVSDAIMVARGDLGIETRAERVPVEQKRIIALSRKCGKPVIVATQILQSMVSNPIATRAEVSDAANAIFDHADGFMLSNETAVGDYPYRAVATLAHIASITEEAIFKDNELSPVPSNVNSMREDETMALNACYIAEKIKARAIVIMSKNGFTARTVLKHRPKTPVIVITRTIDTARNLNFLWGIEKIIIKNKALKSEEALRILREKGQIKKGQETVFIKLSNEKRSLVQIKA
ncbi:pyruvate kinase [Candidatus Peregrinibacteria bacterium]|nr:pyruvate kinase [Candidatus Peregrinibacteria bacterium]